MQKTALEQQHQLAIKSPNGLCFGKAPKPVVCGFALELGAGRVFPELNFTLPPMTIEETTWPLVRSHYKDIAEMIRRAAKRLRLDGLVVEFEHLPPMTENPAWGAEITALLNQAMKEAYESDGLRSALRVTPTDIRDLTRPPKLRSGSEWEALITSFEQCAKAGAQILSIESVGGKEVHDEALLYGDVAGILFALGVLAPRDMEVLWTEIVRISGEYRIIAGGDSACGFANTAMQLAQQGMLPEVFAAVVRAASAPRSLVAHTLGALGPSKDCAYEGPILKALTGIPISMEGKSASCAHFSPVGNVAAAACDLWSNESVQDIRLLSGSAPEAYLELLAYDCRLFNKALEIGTELQYQTLLVESDVHLSPQALILSPVSTVRIASVIAAESDIFRQTVSAACEAVDILTEAVMQHELSLSEQESRWLKKIEGELHQLPSDQARLIEMMTERYGHLFSPSSYGL